MCLLCADGWSALSLWAVQHILANFSLRSHRQLASTGMQPGLWYAFASNVSEWLCLAAPVSAWKAPSLKSAHSLL